MRIRGDQATLNFHRNTSPLDIAYIKYDHTNLFFDFATSGKNIRFINRSGWGESMRINVAGNVGIGTTNPDSKLTVKGDIHAEEVRVDLSVPGPDYVFEEDYDLPSLESIQQYVKENKHLPEVPAAKELEENGIDLGVMNMLLLRKVEELTLHLIEQDKINKEQAEEIAELRKLIEN